MSRRLLIAFALVAAVAAGVLAGRVFTSSPEPSFWAKIRYGAGTAEGEYLYDSVADITPGAPDSGTFKAAKALIQGTIVDIEAGIAFASDDSENAGTVVAYDNEDAAIRFASLVVRVDSVLAGQLGEGYTDGRIRLQIEHPATVTLADLKGSIGTAGTGLMFAQNLAERRSLVGRPITDPVRLAYARGVYTSIGEGLFVEESAGSPVIAPLMDPSRAADLLGYSYTPEDEVGEATPTPTTTCSELDEPCYTPTGKPTASATSVPVSESESATPPTLTALRTTLVAAACAEGTASVSC